MDGDKVKIEKLADASNWMQWKFQIQAILDARDALEVIDGTLVKPEGENLDAAVLNQWKKANKVAKAILVTTLDKKPLSLVMMCETAREMWVKLLNIYEQKSADSVYLLQTQFREYRYNSGDDIATHVSKLESFARRLQELNEPISDTMLITTILNTLPPAFRHFHSAWDSTPAAERTLDKLISRLMVEETRLGINELSTGAESALVAKKQLKGSSTARTNKKDKSDSSKTKLKCWTCGGPHLRRDCTEKKKDNIQDKEKEKTHGLAMVSTQSKVFDATKWIIDSGCTEHVCWQIECFTNYEKLQESVTFELGDGRKVSAEGSGQIKIRSHVDGKEHYFQNVMFVPEMKANLFSVKSVAEKGFRQTIVGDKWLFKKNGKLIIEGQRENDMYILDIDVLYNQGYSFVARSQKEKSLQVWHERMGHQSKAHVKEILTSKGIEISSTNKTEYCDGCSFGKCQRTNFREMSKATKKGELIVTDVCGPMEEPSWSGYRFFVTFKDDFTQYRKVYFIRHKNEVAACFEQYIKSAHTQTGNMIKTIMSDNGTEYTDQAFVEIAKKNGIEIGRSSVYTPQQNGRAERENRTLIEMARTMLLTHGMSKRFWAEALNCAAYILNHSGKSREKGKTPYEVWSNREYSLHHLKIFGSECFVQIPKKKRDDKKFGKTSKRGIFVGYENITGNYRIWIPEEKRIEISRDVEFREVAVPEALIDLSQGEDKTEVLQEKEPEEEEHTQEENQEKQREESKSTYQLRNRATIQAPQRFTYLCQRTLIEPNSYDEALQVPEKENWIKAMDEEMDSHRKNCTWKLVEPNQDIKPLSAKWVYCVKNKANGEVDRYKARLVIKGYEQVYGVNYTETFSPVVRYDTVRLLLWMAAADNLEISQFDCKTAFLNGELEESIFMVQPEGYNDGTGRVCKLIRSLYGLKQAPRCWNQKLSLFLNSIGFINSLFDPCVFIKQDNEKLIVIAIYVDDGLIFANRTKDIHELVYQLQNKFEITICNEVSQFLGFQIERLDNGNIKIHQAAYIQRTLEMFKMDDCHPSKVPADKASLDILYAEKEVDTEHPVASVVGRLMYLVVTTRPDLAYAVGKAAQHMSKPTTGLWKFVKRILRYLSGTVGLGIVYSNSFDNCLIIFTDADYAGDLLTRRSTTGYVSTLGSGAITWSSQRQSCVALSTTEAEYVAASTAAKELVWLHNIVSEFKPKIQAQLLMDNQAAIRLANNPEQHKRTKHISVRYHYIRELVLEKKIKLDYIDTNNQVADMFTKPLGFQRLRELSQKIGMR